MAYYFSQSSIYRMRGIHRDLKLILQEAIKVTPIDFGIPQYGGLRTEADQQILFAQRTASGKQVTQADGIKKRSRHQDGLAVDVFAYVNGKASWDKAHLSMVAGVLLATAIRLAKEGKIDVYLKWGGTFGSNKLKGWDMPHFEVR